MVAESNLSDVVRRGIYMNQFSPTNKYKELSILQVDALRVVDNRSMVVKRERERALDLEVERD